MNNAMRNMLALGRLPAGVMNKTEAEFARELEMQLKAGLIADWKFEVETFKLGNARVKIKVAAQQNPMYRFIAVKKRSKKDGGGWIREEF